MLFLVSVLFLVLFGSSVSRASGLIISAEPGDDVTLRCEAPNINEVLVLEWIRSDLKKDKHVFFYRDEHVDLEYQDESFKNRVFLKNNQMNDGDLSVVLKNVKIEDSGTYECRVLQMDDPQRELKLISSIRLMVIPPPGNTGGKIWGLLALMAVPGLIAVVVVFWIRYKKEKAKQRSVIIVMDINPDDNTSMEEYIDTIQKENPDLKVEEFKSTCDSETESKNPNSRILLVRRDFSKDLKSRRRSQSDPSKQTKNTIRSACDFEIMNSQITEEELQQISQTLSSLRKHGSSCREAAAVDV